MEDKRTAWILQQLELDENIRKLLVYCTTLDSLNMMEQGLSEINKSQLLYNLDFGLQTIFAL